MNRLITKSRDTAKAIVAKAIVDRAMEIAETLMPILESVLEDKAEEMDDESF